MSHVETCEVLIVGGGKSGKTLAADLGRSGRDVILVERGMIGVPCPEQRGSPHSAHGLHRSRVRPRRPERTGGEKSGARPSRRQGAGVGGAASANPGRDTGSPEGGDRRPLAEDLGFAMLGAEAGEVTAVVQMAMLGGLPYTALRDGILAHPTMAEGLNYLFGVPLT